MILQGGISLDRRPTVEKERYWFSNAAKAPRTNKAGRPMAELTVLVPVKQIDASMLREAIRSLVKQTLCDLRILILCASDADATSRVVDEFQDERIEIVRCDESDTISEQLNRGIELADTDLIARADADDINERWRLERQVRFMKSDLDTAVVGTALTIINNEGVPINLLSVS